MTQDISFRAGTIFRGHPAAISQTQRQKAQGSLDVSAFFPKIFLASFLIPLKNSPRKRAFVRKLIKISLVLSFSPLDTMSNIWQIEVSWKSQKS